MNDERNAPENGSSSSGDYSRRHYVETRPDDARTKSKRVSLHLDRPESYADLNKIASWRVLASGIILPGHIK
jgi:hypothetical protein